MRTAKIVILTTCGVILLEVVAVEIFLRTQSFTARDKPSWLEATVARHARSVSTPADAKALKNPRSLNDETRAEAREHWVEHCSICHGIDGRGDTTVGRNLSPPVPDMNHPLTQDRTDGELFYIISKGVRLTGMPAWEAEDSREAIWDLVAFIRHLPQLAPEELEQLKQLAGEEPELQGDKPGQGRADAVRTKTDSGGRTSKPHKDRPGAKPHKH